MPCWWDRVRPTCGSPFAEEILEKYEIEIFKMVEQEGQEIPKDPGLEISSGTLPWEVAMSVDSFLQGELGP